jgi:lipopolysaccharide export system permease protein
MIFKDFSYSTWDDNYNVKRLIDAEFADWEPPIWVLKTGQIIEQDENQSFVSKPFKIFTQRLPESPDDFLVPEYESAEMSLTRLFSCCSVFRCCSSGCQSSFCHIRNGDGICPSRYR